MTATLAGCAAVGPDYQKPQTAIPEQWTAGADLAREDLSQWWQYLGDPVLTSLIESALQGSPDLRSAQARLREARARRNLAAGGHFPTVTGSTSGDRVKTASRNATSLYNAGFDASWEPDVFGGIRRDVEAAEADLEASQLSLHDTQVSLAAEVALNYVELRSAQARLRIARESLATQSETLQITDWRAQAGLATQLDVEQARTSRDQTEAAIPTLETTLAEADHRLAVLLGMPPASLHALLSPVADLPRQPDHVATGIPADTLRQRPDVRAAERSLAAATARIGVATAERYPSFTLNGSLGWTEATLGALLDSGNAAASLAASMMVVLFDGGRIRSRIEIQNAQQEQALVAYEQAVLTALEDVENALVAYANNRLRQTSLRQAAVSSRNAAVMARQLFETGNTDFQKVLDTERSKLLTEEALAIAEAQGLTTLIQLYKALGGGWQEITEPSESTQP